MKPIQIIITVVLIILAAGGGFFAGTKYQQSPRPAGFNRNTLTQRPINRLGGNRPVAGEIISADDKTITVKTIDGSSKIVIFSQTTSIKKASSATALDLKVGESVAVFGTANPDGSVTAQNIQLNPSNQIRSN